MVLASMGLFLGPLVPAILAACYCGPDRLTQLVGTLLGLLVGMTVCVTVANLLTPQAEETA